MSYRERHSLDSYRVERKKLGAHGTIRLTLPFPPPRDQLFLDAGEKTRLRTTRYKEWRAFAAAEILRQRPRCVVGPVEITITLEEKPARRDADQFIEPVLASLVENGIIAGDRSKSLRRVTVQWGALPGAVVEIARLG